MLDVQHSMLSLRVDHVTTAHSLEPVKPCAPSIGIPPWLCLFRFLIIGRSVEGGYNRSSIFFSLLPLSFSFHSPFSLCPTAFGAQGVAMEMLRTLVWTEHLQMGWEKSTSPISFLCIFISWLILYTHTLWQLLTALTSAWDSSNSSSTEGESWGWILCPSPSSAGSCDFRSTGVWGSWTVTGMLPGNCGRNWMDWSVQMVSLNCLK